MLHPEASTQQILEALRAGAREFLYPPLAQTLRRLQEALAAERLDEVIERADLERRHGILVVGGGEHHFRRVPHRLQHPQPRHLRQLHVEEHQIRLQAIDHLDGGAAVGRLARDPYPADAAEVFAQVAARLGLVLDQDRRHEVAAHAGDFCAPLSGSVTVARKPPSVERPVSRLAASP